MDRDSILKEMLREGRTPTPRESENAQYRAVDVRAGLYRSIAAMKGILALGAVGDG